MNSTPKNKELAMSEPGEKKNQLNFQRVFWSILLFASVWLLFLRKYMYVQSVYREQVFKKMKKKCCKNVNERNEWMSIWCRVDSESLEIWYVANDCCQCQAKWKPNEKHTHTQKKKKTKEKIRKSVRPKTSLTRKKIALV